MDQSPEWAARQAAGIGERVAYYRRQGKLSAQELADRCSGLGLPSLSRMVITKLENGRREAVSTAELQVLAQALGVPAVLLLFPVGHAPAVEALPGVNADPWAAYEWFIGKHADPADPRSAPQLGSHSPLVLWAECLHAEEMTMVSAWSRAELTQRVAEAAEAGEAEEVERLLRLLRAEDDREMASMAALVRIRTTMAERGLTPPGYWRDTAEGTGEEGTSGAR